MADDTLKDLRDRYSYSSTEWEEVRSQARVDMRYVAGDPWDPVDRQKRKDAGRPCLALDELGQYSNQFVNGLRLNPRGIKFAPKGNGANDESARFYENKAREIEYRSKADQAYITAAQNAFNRSYGWVRVDLRWASERSFDKEIWIQGVPNPDMVLCDPDIKQPDASDMQYLFFSEVWPRSEFQRRFPKAKANPRVAAGNKQLLQWVTDQTVMVSEYWAIEHEARQLILLVLPGGEQFPIFQDELDDAEAAIREIWAGAREADQRTVQWPRVIQRITNGVEILEETPWVGKYIPFAACFGKMLYLDRDAGAKRVILSATRLARDPYMAYCFYRTCEIEAVGMVTKNPYWAYAGQLNPKQLKEVQKSIHEPVAVLFAEPTVEGTPPGQILPLPQRNPMAAQIESLSVGAEEMRRAIQAAFGIAPLPTPALKQNEKSGIALQQIQSSEQLGSYHFVDAYDGMIQQVGIIIEDLIGQEFSGPREVGVMKADQTAEIVRINQPDDPKSPQTAGEHQVTVSTGPAKESERVAADAFVDTLVGALPVLAEVATPPVAAAVLARSVRLKNLGPLGDAIADLIEPPQFKKGGPPDPRLLQLQAQLEQYQKIAQELSLQRATEQAKYEGQYTIEALKQDKQAALQIALHAMDNAARILQAQITASKDAELSAMELGEERVALAHDAAQQALDRLHDVGMAKYQQAIAPPPVPGQPTGASV